ncbi:hypothetical protein AB4Z55_18085 [Gordonia sp. ABKF26]|uniref:PGN_0703 family putative restriction endonuclease n=1 Tax=Gordonia sp. ABKF26 TaxID=3238687 RepID=UPI0034E5C770
MVIQTVQSADARPNCRSVEPRTSDSHLDARLLDAIGPQRPTEPLLARRVRFHQSWYRAAVLGIPQYGHTAGRVQRPMGSVLTDRDALAARNFTSPCARRLYERRRLEGWGVDPVRCTKYLTSSQALTLNLLGPLSEYPLWAARVLGRVMERPDVYEVVRLWVEFAPRRRSQYLDDMTRIDALIEMRTSRGAELLAVEIKYSDRFNSRQVYIDRRPYRDLAAYTGLWRSVNAALQTPQVNQLVRCHALATIMSNDLIGKVSTANLLVVHHTEDRPSRQVAEDYVGYLNDPAIAHVATLDAFVEALAGTAVQPRERLIAANLRVRYTAESESEAAWRMSGDRSLRVKHRDERHDSKR